MSTEHRNLTGAALHEPKGVDTADSGTVYIANGTGSGSWINKNADNLVFNSFVLQDTMADIGTVGDSVFFYIPYQCDIQRLSATVYGAMTVANSILSIYVNGVARPETLTCTYTGSAAGSSYSQTTFAAHTITAGSVIEIRTDGGSTAAVKAAISLVLKAK